MHSGTASVTRQALDARRPVTPEYSRRRALSLDPGRARLMLSSSIYLCGFDGRFSHAIFLEAAVM
jgi:hypothetical protein